MSAPALQTAWQDALWREHMSKCVAEAMQFSTILGDNPEAERLTPNEARLVALAYEVRRLQGAETR